VARRVSGISSLQRECRRVFNRLAVWIEIVFPLLLVALGFCLRVLVTCAYFYRRTTREIKQIKGETIRDCKEHGFAY
jgi:hypothetical protein